MIYEKELSDNMTSWLGLCRQNWDKIGQSPECDQIYMMVYCGRKWRKTLRAILIAISPIFSYITKDKWQLGRIECKDDSDSV